MMVFLNDRFVPEEQAVVSVFDRGFLYGDGLFETIRISRGEPYRWRQHLERLRQGAVRLGIRVPLGDVALADVTRQLIQRENLKDCLLRITLSRGKGTRGYSPSGANQPTLVLSLHLLAADWAALKRWRLVTSTLRIADPLAGVKSSSKLLQVLARAEADQAGADEALLLDARGTVAEATSSNVFWIQTGTVRTAPLSVAVLPGITRQAVIEVCSTNGIPFWEGSASPAELREADGVFLTQTSFGIVEVAELDGHAIRASDLTARLHRLLLAEMGY